MSIIVPSFGPKPADLMFVGEAPGYDEAHARPPRPFVGASGRLQASRLTRHGLNPERVYYANVCQEYTPGNPDPTSAQIARWLPQLYAEIEEVDPAIIVAVGRFASDVFLEHCPPLESCHGMPHRWAGVNFNPRIVIPIYHPAGGLHDYTRRPWIFDDYAELSHWYLQWKQELPIHFREDIFAGKELYLDCDAETFCDLMERELYEICGIDTEGEPGNQYSIQVSTRPGVGYVLRCSQPGFSRAIKVLSSLIRKRRILVCMHQADTPEYSCYDLVMCKEMGLDLYRARIHDTMYSAGLRRIEPKGLKELCDRYFAKQMADYKYLVYGLSRGKQLEYLKRAYTLSESLPKPEPYKFKEPNGVIRTKRPKHIKTLIDTLISDVECGKVNKDGLVNPKTRWKGFDLRQRKKLEAQLGPLPQATLADIPLAESTDYAAADADGTLRVSLFQLEHNPRWGLPSSPISVLSAAGNKLLPIISEMQMNGMPVSRRYFEALDAEMDQEVDKHRDFISREYFSGRPFNPSSTKDTTKLLLIRGLTPSRTTPSGLWSTDAKSIGEFQYTDKAIEALFDARRAKHNKETYTEDVLERVPEDQDFYILHPNYSTTRVHTRRLSSPKCSLGPNILAIPTRTEVGNKVRKGYIAPAGKCFLSVDYSGFEVRCMAHESRDPILVKGFNTPGWKPHETTAARLFNIDVSQVGKREKATGKTINFGMSYGMGPGGLFDKFHEDGILGYSFDDCSKFLSDYLKIYAGIAEYKRRVVESCRRDEIVYDHWGMPRHLPGINLPGRDREERSIRGEEERAAVSHRIQGLATGMIQNAMRWLIPKIDALICSGMFIQWLLLLHDELIFLLEDGAECKELVAELVLEAFRHHSGIDLCVPIEAEAHFGYTWGDLK